MTSERSGLAHRASGPLLEYRSDGAWHQAFFPDAAAIRSKARMLLSRHSHTRGVYAWHMGQEDPRVWPELARLLHTQTPARD